MLLNTNELKDDHGSSAESQLGKQPRACAWGLKGRRDSLGACILNLSPSTTSGKVTEPSPEVSEQIELAAKWTERA